MAAWASKPWHARQYLHWVKFGEVGYFSPGLAKPSSIWRPNAFSIENCGTVATVAPIDPFFGASLQHSAARNVSLEPPGSLTQVELVGKELRRYVCNPENSTE
jgi:hypothetical protein